MRSRGSSSTFESHELLQIEDFSVERVCGTVDCRSEDLNLAELHEIIQRLFGWEGCHTYDFLKKNGDCLDPRYERIDGKLRIVDPKEAPDAFTIGDVLPGPHLQLH